MIKSRSEKSRWVIFPYISCDNTAPLYGITSTPVSFNSFTIFMRTDVKKRFFFEFSRLSVLKVFKTEGGTRLSKYFIIFEYKRETSLCFSEKFRIYLQSNESRGLVRIKFKSSSSSLILHKIIINFCSSFISS